MMAHPLAYAVFVAATSIILLWASHLKYPISATVVASCTILMPICVMSALRNAMGVNRLAWALGFGISGTILFIGLLCITLEAQLDLRRRDRG